MLHLHRAARADRLVDALAAVVADPLDDPLATEVVAVHSRGIERWLAQELSTRLGASPGRQDGVCANIQFPFPSRVVARGLGVAGGPLPEADPWRPERLVWPLLEVIGAHLSAEWLAPLRAHIGPPAEAEPQRRGRRFSATRHIADLFDRYATHRPAMVRDWAEGREVDGAGSTLHESFLWQPRLWRLVRDRVAVPSPAERLTLAVERLRAGAGVPDLPSRVSLFGLTALPASYLAVLAAMASHRDVHLFLLHPSPVLWRRVGEHERRPEWQTGPGGRDHSPARGLGQTGRDLGLAQIRSFSQTAPIQSLGRLPLLRENDPTREAARHPLLASWGRDARELQLVVTSPADDFVDDHLPLPTPEPRTLLGLIQAQVRADAPPPGLPLGADRDPRPVLAAEDRSLQVHACHGRTRQVEVLRDAILHIMADDHTLEPRDVVVMCPDIDTFAPVVHAVFGAHALADDGVEGQGRGLPHLRVRLADRAIRQTNPVLRVVAELLALAGGRLTASEVLGFSSCDPVRRRFGFEDDNLQRLEAWVTEARIRWGLDAEHRAAFGLAGLHANTWRAGLDRLLVGVAMADEDERLVAGTAPLDDVEGGEVELAGRFVEFMHRLSAALGAFATAQPVALWRDTIVAAAESLTATSERDRWQRVQLHRLLDDVVWEATGDGSPSPVELTLSEVRSLLEDRLRGGPSRANHRTGDLTVSTLVPMRSVPHRVICLLGLDDGAFPRRTAPDGDDITNLDPRVGDRDARTEDRQLLLDALLAAGDHLVVTYTGRDERTNEPRPPAVPIGELLDLVDRTVRTDEPVVPARARALVEHPLQPFDARNFRVGDLVADRPWGFD
ncbi:MAG: exodeoxyribonuclease V subunit gamma, partial [Actinomycetota bacterium]|nr:exodeoxyribonuclease V subunit gamma [Actinomycetota bacterium]